MFMSMVAAALIKFGSQLLVATGILAFRYIEKTSVIKHYKKKLEELLNK